MKQLHIYLMVVIILGQILAYVALIGDLEPRFAVVFMGTAIISQIYLSELRIRHGKQKDHE